MADIDMPDAGDESDISAIFDPVTPPRDQLRTYTVVHPPELPEWTSIDGTDYKTVWHEDSWRYTARAYEEFDGCGFEVRQLNISNRDDEEPEDPINRLWWPPKYALGAPGDEATEWNGLISKWGFPILEKAGFLNYYPANDAVDGMKPLGRLARTRNPKEKTTELIHPILRRDMWEDIDDDEYELMEPALLLASAILDDPATLAFFHAIADTNSMTQFHDATYGPYLVASVPATLNDQQQTEVFSKLVKMRDWTKWNLMRASDMVTIGGYGLTKTLKKTDGSDHLAGLPYTAQSDIYVSQAYITVLERYNDDQLNNTNEHGEHLDAWLDRFNVPASRRPQQLYAQSAYDRTIFNLADTMVHEFAHAFGMAYFPTPPSQTHQRPEEPWIQGNRSNELGCALINHLFGGLAFSMIGYDCSGLTEHRQAVDCPLGMYCEGQWDLWTVDDGVERVLTASVAGVAGSVQTAFPLPQKYFYNMHTEETWKHQVPRFGLASIRIPRLKDWSMTFTKKP